MRKTQYCTDSGCTDNLVPDIIHLSALIFYWRRDWPPCLTPLSRAGLATRHSDFKVTAKSWLAQLHLLFKSGYLKDPPQYGLDRKTLTWVFKHFWKYFYKITILPKIAFFKMSERSLSNWLKRRQLRVSPAIRIIWYGGGYIIWIDIMLKHTRAIKMSSMPKLLIVDF